MSVPLSVSGFRSCIYPNAKCRGCLSSRPDPQIKSERLIGRRNKQAQICSGSPLSLGHQTTQSSARASTEPSPSWNKGAEHVFGYTAEEIIGKHITTLMTPDRYEEEQSILQRLRRGERLEPFETIRRRKDGSLIHVSVTISPIKNVEGRIIGASK